MKFDLKLNKIHHGDSLKLVEKIKDNSIDLIVCDGPYGVTDHIWDKITDIQSYNLNIIQKFSRILKPGGSLYLFGKDNCIDFIDYRPYLTLNRKIIWFQPRRLQQGKNNYTNNYDIIVYFSKGSSSKFNLDDIRVPHMTDKTKRINSKKVPSVLNGKHSSIPFNPAGKNPGNMWNDINQLTYRSKELIDRKNLNTIQKPEKLIERIVKASSNENDIVLDPFSGTGTTFAVCKRFKRNFLGFEIDKRLIKLSNKRIKKLEDINNENQRNNRTY